MEKCPKCGNEEINEVIAIGGVKRLICSKCGFQINLDKKRED